ncbi:TetR family transcriptional regulator [Roseateles koreensis]|uniref:TetR family transcriptional regulator n=1 Tax=Roseateles koreensis TaxID=2987526 RepID=A0ABT5KR25_9BURK|nr:TetR family transcriptional regulator [Roseateles koreensis]MDC8785372.1 TetR family transcriptional regulator [Roseateles koreensis]
MARKTKQEALETRMGILDAAEQLFQQHGVSRSSLQDIAVAAGVTRGAIYWHFKDKAEVFNAMMERATMPLEEGLSLAPDDTSATPSAKNKLPPGISLTELRWGLVNVFHAAMHNERARCVFEIAMQKVEYTGEMQTLRERKLTSHRQWRDQNQSAFERAKAQGQLPASLDTRTAAVTLVALVDGFLHQWIMDPEAFDLVAVGRTAVETYLTALSLTGKPLLPPMTAEELARLGQGNVCPSTR